jgi:glycoside/pentoside/hexuronide:cation symporter, GPH family
MTGPLRLPAPGSALPAGGRQAAPLWVDLAYGGVGLAATLPWAIVDTWLLYFYLPPSEAGPRVPAAFYGVPVLVACLVNIVICPLIGHLSDRTRGRWGRRRPFISAGALPLLVAFGLLWQPPVAEMSALNLVYLTLILIVYNAAYSVVMVPYTSLLPELAKSEFHRVRLASVWAGAQMLGVLLAALAGPLIQQLGYAPMAWLYAAAAVPLFYLPLLALRELPGHQTPPASRLGFRASLTFTVHNRGFLILTVAGFCSGLAVALLLLIIPFLVTEICGLTPADSAWFYGAAVLTSLACYPIVTWLSQRFGKQRIVAGSLVLSGLALPGLALIGPWWPIPLLAQGVLWIILESAAAAPVNVLLPAFIADLTDEDARRTAQRREGAYYSAWILQSQLVTGVAAVAVPVILLLGRSHLDTHGPLGLRVTSLIGGGLFCLAYLFFRRYPAPTGGSKDHYA